MMQPVVKEGRVTVGAHGHKVNEKGLRKGHGFSERKKYSTKQNKTSVTPEKDHRASANQTPGGYKFAPLVDSQL